MIDRASARRRSAITAVHPVPKTGYARAKTRKGNQPPLADQPANSWPTS